MITVELTAAIDAAGTLQTFYFATDVLVTGAADTPANTPFSRALNDPGSIGVSAFGDGRTGGASRLELGEVVIANADGAYDVFKDYGFDGRPVVIRSGLASAAYPAGFSTILTATAESADVTRKEVRIRLRDKGFVFDRPALSVRYAGNNALPNGLEGTATDLKGKVKPKVYGKVANISPPLVNTSKLTYQVSNGAVADITAVYDRGAALVKGADFATSALLQAAAPAAGSYVTCFAEGYFRLGSAPAGLITADVVQGAAAANRTAAQVLKQLALDAGVSAGDISAADVAALDVANAAVVGLYLPDETTFQSAMDQVAASVGAYYAFDTAGVLRMGRLAAPAGGAALALETYQILDIERRPARDNGLPVWSVTVEHSRLYTVQPQDLAGAVTAPRRAELALERRSEAAEDASIKAQFLLAKTMIVQTLLTAAADAATEAARLLGLHKVRRDVLDVTVPLSASASVALKPMDVVSLTHDRLGLAAGKSFRLLGLRLELARHRLILTVWG